MLKQEVIQFSIGQCEAGFVLVGCSSNGVCAVNVAETPEQAYHEFSNNFAKAELMDAEGAIDGIVNKVLHHIDAPRGKPKVKLDVRGSDFQKRVWKAVMDVPAGKTASYADIAHAIGAPSAARAVGTACGKNKLSFLVPCHRIVRSGAAAVDLQAPGGSRRRALRQRETGKAKKN